MSFFPMAWLTFLVFWILFWVLYVFEILHGIVPMGPTRGVDLTLQESVVRVADLVKLKAGQPLRPPDAMAWNGIDALAPFVILEVEPSGEVRWRNRVVDLSRPIPWASMVPNPAETTVFIRPMPGVSYGDVVTVIDWLRQAVDDGIEVRRLFLVRCEPGPSVWDDFPAAPPTEPLERQPPVPSPATPTSWSDPEKPNGPLK